MKMSEKTPYQQYVDGEITEQKMFNQQDEETAYQVALGIVVLSSLSILFMIYKLVRYFG